ncbi:hypothetical protein HBI56_058830 [Parastagonospora nodorum]|nr:hypothetical protein HBH56_159820 [Parastagonospora nodorum]KAH3922372.1 hypothetical protein HBH54_224250 [Parastagonospora nodorum]KAH3946909.1 hypothetical protein HBH53_122110 [Parastagonospora nodorum]KAH3969767.1 hypothetical protein HBH52_170120 [Parastagonospora nodorum]KAH3973424.1 hypothetical protein HBH51_095320 [Parastagonospora nodorum]
MRCQCRGRKHLIYLPASHPSRWVNASNLCMRHNSVHSYHDLTFSKTVLCPEEKVTRKMIVVAKRQKALHLPESRLVQLGVKVVIAS